MEAIDHALHHPLLGDISIEYAKGIIASFSSSSELSFDEFAVALTYLQEKTNSQVEIIPGVVIDETMVNRLQVTLIITGIGGIPLDLTKHASETLII